jgi:hypothetical protein
VVLESDTPRSLIEVKLGVRMPHDGDSSRSPDLQQVLGHSRELNISATLMACNKIFLIAPGASTPTTIIERDSATAADLRNIGQHLAR